MTYNTKEACKAQDDYCEKNELPHFAPFDGLCYYCGNSIYAEGGVSVEEASAKLITGCPWCRHSYCE